MEISDNQSHFEMVLAVLERLGRQCNHFLANLNKFNDRSCLSSLSFAIDKFPNSVVPEAEPSRAQLERTAYKISDLLTWEFFASRVRKLDGQCAIFKPGDPLLNTDIEFVRLNFPCTLPNGIAETPSFKRAQFARKLEKIEGVPVSVENTVDFELLPPAFFYVKSNIYSDAIPRSALEPVVGCQCSKGQCCEASNCCPKMAGIDDFPYFSSQQQNTLRDVDRTQAVYECTSMCSCSANCPNRVVQNGLRVPLLLFKTQNGRGWGLKTLAKLHKGQFVIEYCGEVLEAGKSARSSPFTFALDFNEDRLAKYHIDGTRFGCLARFINSRCGDANLTAHAVYVDCVDSALPRIAFFARRNISALEELTFDYFDGLAHSGQVCLCESPFCRQRDKIMLSLPGTSCTSNSILQQAPVSSDFFSLSNASSSRRTSRKRSRLEGLEDSGFDEQNNNNNSFSFQPLKIVKKENNEGEEKNSLIIVLSSDEETFEDETEDEDESEVDDEAALFHNPVNSSCKFLVEGPAMLASTSSWTHFSNVNFFNNNNNNSVRNKIQAQNLQPQVVVISSSESEGEA